MAYEKVSEKRNSRPMQPLNIIFIDFTYSLRYVKLNWRPLCELSECTDSYIGHNYASD